MLTFIMQHKFSKTNWFINAYIHRKKYLSPKFYKMRWFGGNLKVLCHIIKLKSFRKINWLVSLGWLLNLFFLSLAGCLENIKTNNKELFYDESPWHIETTPLIYSANEMCILLWHQCHMLWKSSRVWSNFM